MKLDKDKLSRCNECHAELGLYVVRIDPDDREQFCSQTCVRNWENEVVERHPFFEPEILEIH